MPIIRLTEQEAKGLVPPEKGPYLSDEQKRLIMEGKRIYLTEEQRAQLWSEPPVPSTDRGWYRKLMAELDARDKAKKAAVVKPVVVEKKWWHR